MTAKARLPRSCSVALCILGTMSGVAAAGERTALSAQPGWFDAPGAPVVAKTAPTREAIVAAARAAVAAHGGSGGDADDVRVLTTKAGTHAVIFVPRR